MPAIMADPEQWYTDYEAASVKQQYQLMLEAIAQPISPEVIEELDFGMLLVMMRDELVNHNQIEQALDLIQTVQEKQPTLYEQEFQFLDNFRLEYYLYRNQLDQVHQALQQFIARPADDIDQTLAILDYLVFYNAADLAIELSRAAYLPVQQSQNVVLGTEMEFSAILLHQQIQQAHQQLQAGETVDWKAFQAEATAYGFDNNSKWVEEIHQQLIHPVQSNPEFFARFKRDRPEAIRALAISFCQDMAQKQFSFVCSYALWETVIEFLEERDLPRKKLSQPDAYFSFTQDQLDPYVTRKIGGFLSMQQVVGVGLLWALPYVYDWLLAKQMIGETVHQQAIDVATDLKAEFTRGFPLLWKYDFVHRWQPPDSVSPDAFEAEAQAFAASLEQVKPLNDEPGKGGMRSVMDGLSHLLPPELRQEFESMDEEEMMRMLMGDEDGDEDELDLLDEPIASSKPMILDSSKSPKPRKSALKLAAELPDKNKPSSVKKKNGKGKNQQRGGF